MAVSYTDLTKPQTPAEVRSQALDELGNQRFPVTAWYKGGVAQAFIETFSLIISRVTEMIAAIARANFLQTARGEALTKLAKSHYDETRAEAIAGQFIFCFFNSSGVTQTITAEREIQIRNTQTGYTYSNISFNTSIAANTPSTPTKLTFESDVAGAAYNIYATPENPSRNWELVTQLAGVRVEFQGETKFAGSNEATDEAVIDLCQGKWARLSIDRADAGIRSILRREIPSITDVRVDSTNPRGTGTVDVYLATLTGVPGDIDMEAAQTLLNNQVFGNTTLSPQILAKKSPLQTLSIAAKVYYNGTDETSLETDLQITYNSWINSLPIGGYDYSPGGSPNSIRPSQLVDYMSNVTGVKTFEITSMKLGNVEVYKRFSNSVASLTEEIIVFRNTKIVIGTRSFTKYAVKF